MYSYNPKSVLPPTGAVTGSSNVIDNIDIVVTAGAAFVAGDVVMVPLPTTIATAGDTSTVIGITAQSTSAVAATAAAGNIRDGTGRKVFGVVLNASVASGALMTIRVRGVVAANLTSNTAAGYPKAAGAKVLADVAAAGTVNQIAVIGYSLEAGTGVKYAYFDGTGALGTVSTA